MTICAYLQSSQGTIAIQLTHRDHSDMQYSLPPGAYHAKTPFLLPGPKKESSAHDGQICTGAVEDLNPQGQPRQIRT